MNPHERVTARTVDCVAESARTATLIGVGPDGVQPWTTVALRPVPAYQRATMAVCVLLIVLGAVLTRPLLVGAGTGWRGGVDVGVLTTSWLLVTVSARWVWARLVESLLTDTAHAILDTTTSIGPPPATSGPDLGGQW